MPLVIPSPLADGEIVLDERFRFANEETWCVGGQSERSYRVAWMLLESLLDRPGDWRVDPWWLPNPIARAASYRWGNCLEIRVVSRELAERRRACLSTS